MWTNVYIYKQYTTMKTCVVCVWPRLVVVAMLAAVHHYESPPWLTRTTWVEPVPGIILLFRGSSEMFSQQWCLSTHQILTPAMTEMTSWEPFKPSVAFWTDKVLDVTYSRIAYSWQNCPSFSGGVEVPLQQGKKKVIWRSNQVWSIDGHQP